MKKVFFILAFSIATLAVSAQKTYPNIGGFKISGGLNLAIPASNFDPYSIGAGVDLLGQYGLSKSVGLTIDAGYTSLFPKKSFKDIGVEDLTIIPLRAGLRFYPSSSFYLGGKAGLGILKAKNSNSVNTTAYSFGAGYMMSPALDLGVSYDGYSKNGSSGLVNVRLGYFFGN